MRVSATPITTSFTDVKPLSLASRRPLHVFGPKAADSMPPISPRVARSAGSAALRKLKRLPGSTFLPWRISPIAIRPSRSSVRAPVTKLPISSEETENAEAKPMTEFGHAPQDLPDEREERRVAGPRHAGESVRD